MCERGRPVCSAANSERARGLRRVESAAYRLEAAAAATSARVGAAEWRCDSELLAHQAGDLRVQVRRGRGREVAERQRREQVVAGGRRERRQLVLLVLLLLYGGQEGALLTRQARDGDRVGAMRLLRRGCWCGSDCVVLLLLHRVREGERERVCGRQSGRQLLRVRGPAAIRSDARRQRASVSALSASWSMNELS